MRISALAVVLAALVAGGIGFGASHVWDGRAIDQLKADLDGARDCRKTGATLPPCPVRYAGTKIEWRDRTVTVETPDPKQSTRIASLSAELADARNRIHDLEQRRAWRGAARANANRWQNGTIAYPYSSDESCAPGTVVVYEAVGGPANRRSGDPNVCYVRSLRNTVAYSSERR